MNEETNDNDLQEIITQYLQDLKKQLGENYDSSKVNLVEMERITGISRGKLRKIKKDGFVVKPHGNAGKKAASTVLTVHDVTWKHSASFCKDQYVKQQPEEFPTMPVKTAIFQLEEPKPSNGFEKFNFGEGIWDE